NDIRRGASAEQVIGGLSSLVTRLKARSVRVIGATIIPRHNVQPSGTNSGWDNGKTAIRNEVNQWIRRKSSFDAVVDFDAVMLLRVRCVVCGEPLVDAITWDRASRVLSSAYRRPRW